MKINLHTLCLRCIIAIAVSSHLAAAEDEQSKIRDFQSTKIKARILECLPDVPSLAEELEVTPAQLVELRSIVNDFNRERRIIKLDSYDRFEIGVEKVLLDHQQKRLNQIVLQKKTRIWTGNYEGFNTAVALQKELGLSQAEIESLFEKSLAIKNDYVDELTKDRARIEREILAHLPDEKRAKYRELFGKEFDYQMQRLFSEVKEATQQFEAYQNRQATKEPEK